jgi:hypothetical protein
VQSETPQTENEPTFTRQQMAYLLMVIFVVATTVGAMFFNTGIGFMVLGVTSGIYGYILGRD